MDGLTKLSSRPSTPKGGGRSPVDSSLTALLGGGAGGGQDLGDPPLVRACVFTSLVQRPREPSASLLNGSSVLEKENDPLLPVPCSAGPA